MATKTRDRKPKGPSKSPNCAEAAGSETDWKHIAEALAKKVIFALNHCKPQGTGTLINLKTMESTHWREDFADALELIPGLKVDRAALHAIDMPARERKKWFKDRKANSQNDQVSNSGQKGHE